MMTWSGKSPLVNWLIPYERCAACERQVECLGSPFCLKWIDRFKSQEERRLLKVRRLCIGIISLVFAFLIVYILSIGGGPKI
jgi:hypothetical protein